MICFVIFVELSLVFPFWGLPSVLMRYFHFEMVGVGCGWAFGVLWFSGAIVVAFG